MSMRKLLKQAEEMQSRMTKELNDTVVEASVGGEAVTVRMNGHKKLLGVTIEEEAMEDREMLADLVVLAVNEASRKVDDKLRNQVGSLAASMPNLF